MSVACKKLGPPVQGCSCSFCRSLRPAPPPAPERVIAGPTGDFEDMRR